MTNVEDFQMYVVGSFTGSDGPEKFVIYNPGNTGPSNLIGRGGDDELVGHDFNDNVDGGAGNDHVEGGLGNDTVTGGPGQDTIYGDATAARCTYYSCKIPYGNDVINARDGEADNIDCGIGQDKAIVDAIDVVTNCETVEGGGSNGGPAPGRRRIPGQRPEVHVRADQAGQVRGQGPEGQRPLRRRVHRLGHGDGRQGDRAQARHQEDRLRQGQGEQGGNRDRDAEAVALRRPQAQEAQVGEGDDQAHRLLRRREADRLAHADAQALAGRP